MTPRVRLTTALDFIGTGALLAAAALLGRFWFSAIAETAFTTFFFVLAIAVSAFLLARVVQLTAIVIDSPNERARRVYETSAPNLSTVTTTLSIEAQAQSPATDLQRAA